MSSISMFVSVLTSALLLTPVSIGAKQKDHPRPMHFSGVVRVEEDVQVSVFGTVGPSEFFANLHAADSPDGTIYTNDSGQVRFFPDRITITVRILGPVANGGTSILPGKLNYDLMRSLQFRVQWKHGMKLRSVQEFRFLSATESSFLDLGNSGRPVNGWIYEMVLEDSQVPLTDHLILNILSPENRLLARLSARL